MLQDLRHLGLDTHARRELTERIVDWLDMHQVPMLLEAAKDLHLVASEHHQDGGLCLSCCQWADRKGHTTECSLAMMSRVLG